MDGNIVSERIRSSNAAQELNPFTARQSVASTENPHISEKTIFEEEGERIPGTPITIFKAAAETTNDIRSGHRTEESFETLRKLARVASVSPSSAASEVVERPSKEPAIQVGLASQKIGHRALDKVVGNSDNLTVNIEEPLEETARRLE